MEVPGLVQVGVDGVRPRISALVCSESWFSGCSPREPFIRMTMLL